MGIAKPVRHLLHAMLFSWLTIVLSLLVLQSCSTLWALLLLLLIIPIAWVLSMVVHGLVIDSFDLWLRERTCDASWLWSDKGKRWLETAQGRAWLKTPRGVRWAQHLTRR